MILRLRTLITRRWLTAVIPVIFIVLIFPMAFRAQAADFNVGCTAGVGDTAALVTAINTANGNGQADTINLSAGCTYTLTANLPDITTPITINGSGTAIIDGEDSHRPFLVGSTGDLTLNALTLRNGRADFGGGINNSGTVTVNHSTLSGNSAATAGGGINNTSTVTLNHSTLSGNSAATSGGGIVNSGTVTLNYSTFADNSSQIAGGINNGGTVTLNNSTFSDNSATIHGGGIYNFNAMTVNNSTLSGNSAAFEGGGIYNNGTLTLNNSIIADSPSGGDCVRFLGTVSASHSLIEGGLGCINFVNENNLTGDPSLGALATGANGTQYYPLNEGSIAINAGSNALIPGGVTTDQAGNNRINGGTVDMGSFEYAPASLNVQLSLQGRPVEASPAKVVTVHVEVREAGSLTPILTQDFVSDTNGQFSIPNLMTGAYDIWIKGTHTLAVVHNVTLAAGANSLTTAQLREGDANDDNVVQLTDFSLLASAFGTVVGNPGYNAQADFNNDGQVQLVDFSLLASNFGQTGAP